jgi:hypothetical protein
MDTVTLTGKTLFPTVVTTSGPTLKSLSPVDLIEGDEFTRAVFEREVKRLSAQYDRNPEFGKQQCAKKLLQLHAALEGIDDCIETLEGFQSSTAGVTLDDALRLRAADLLVLYTEDINAIWKTQEPLARSLCNLQLFFDTARETECNIYWLNASEAQIRKLSDGEGRNPVLDAGETNDGDHALLTLMDDTRECKSRASLVVLGDDFESRAAADFWAKQAYRRKLPILASVSQSYFVEDFSKAELDEVTRDLCGTDVDFGFFALAGNHVIQKIDAAKVFASPAFAYAGVLARQATIGAAPIVPNEGRINGELALGALQNWMSIESYAPIAWLVRSNDRTARFNLSHTGSNTSARIEPRSAFTDAIAYTHLARTIQHYLLTDALGKPQNKSEAKRVGMEIVRILKGLTGEEGAVKDIRVEDVEKSDVVPRDGRLVQTHDIRIRFAGSTEDIAVRVVADAKQ